MITLIYKTKVLILLVISLCIAEFSFSQADYRVGFIITNAGDTLSGLVNYREGAKAFRSCDFKRSNDQDPITYEPNQIIGYGFKNDKFFQSRKVTVKGQLPQTVFLEVLVKGFLRLYKFEDNYFVEKGSDGLQQLINETKELYVDGRRVLTNTNEYVRTINMLAFDCSDLRKAIQSFKFQEKKLIDIVEDYNHCKGAPAITFKAEKPWIKAMIGVTGGLNVSKLNLDRHMSSYRHMAGDIEVSTSPVIGISFDVNYPRLHERISLHGDFLYLASSYHMYNQYSDHSNHNEKNSVTFKFQQLNFPIGIRYTFPKRKFTPYFTAGVSKIFYVGIEKKWIQVVETSSSVNTYDQFELIEVKNNQFGVWGGCGVLKSINNKLDAFVELRYEQTNGFVPYHYSLLNSKITNLQLFIGIKTR